MKDPPSWILFGDVKKDLVCSRRQRYINVTYFSCTDATLLHLYRWYCTNKRNDTSYRLFSSLMVWILHSRALLLNFRMKLVFESISIWKTILKTIITNPFVLTTNWFLWTLWHSKYRVREIFRCLCVFWLKDCNFVVMTINHYHCWNWW